MALQYRPGDTTQDTGWLAVSSTCHDRVRWQPTGRGNGTFYCRFVRPAGRMRAKETYAYDNVPRHVFEDYMEASSQGKFYYYAIRSRFPYRGPI